ncbi:MAG: right-handed parallel beta-helix repeat-containing protein [Planctomycetota bacterium]|nr:right-handed parallel beta-helix repeat-containing protein [Planctomycetota bacterium]
MRHRLCAALLAVAVAAEAGGAENKDAARRSDEQPPWPPQYKVHPDEKQRLTAADVLGPDGIVYPNWTRCGVQGGIPAVKDSARIEDFGGNANDDKDDSAALDQACAAVGAKGGGAVVLGVGTYYLDRPVTIRQDGVVIRGQGPDKTKLIFRYNLGPEGVVFYSPAAGARMGKNTPIELHCTPKDLVRMTIQADDVVLRTWEPSTHSGNTFNLSVPGAEITKKLPDGHHLLKGTAEYKGGRKKSCEIKITVDSRFNDTPPPSSRAAICFEGRGVAGEKLGLAKDGARGSCTVALESATGVAVGDCVVIEGPATERWKKLTRNACQWGMYRRYEVRIEKLDGRTLTLNQPLRIEFPVVDGSFVQKTIAIQHCGVEGFSIEQTEDLWISSVMFSHTWNCWARGINVKKCGRFPVYAAAAKWCEIRDCVFDDAWFKGGGGTAYSGWEHSCDCLMESIETFKLRHAPLMQWAASGCVVRKGVFHDSDGQWHSGWTNENLFEQCVITSVRGNGGYGFGLWASPPEDTAHGPNGPRNVVYNCDITSEKAGLWMGGMNENWLILYNRFAAKTGEGVFAKTCSFDHIIKDNVFVLQDGKSPMITLFTPDCTGIELLGNKLLGGNGKIFGGKGSPSVVKDNQVQPLGNAPRPQPAVPSIYEWQKAQARN